MKTKNVAVTLHLTIPSRMSSQRCQELIQMLLSSGWDEAAAILNGDCSTEGISASMFQDCEKALSMQLREIMPGGGPGT